MFELFLCQIATFPNYIPVMPRRFSSNFRVRTGTIVFSVLSVAKPLFCETGEKPRALILCLQSSAPTTSPHALNWLSSASKG